MRIKEALRVSLYDCVTYVSEHGIRWTLDGSGIDYVLTFGKDGLPATFFGSYRRPEQAISFLSPELQQSEEWEPVDE